MKNHKNIKEMKKFSMSSSYNIPEPLSDTIYMGKGLGVCFWSRFCNLGGSKDIPKFECFICCYWCHCAIIWALSHKQNNAFRLLKPKHKIKISSSSSHRSSTPPQSSTELSLESWFGVEKKFIYIYIYIISDLYFQS